MSTGDVSAHTNHINHISIPRILLIDSSIDKLVNACISNVLNHKRILYGCPFYDIKKTTISTKCRCFTFYP